MSELKTYKITIQNPKAYLHAISGITKLTPKECDLLGEIVEYMQLHKLRVLDDSVKEHIIKVAGFTGKYPKQGYYNLIASLKEKKLVMNSRKKMTLRPIVLPGTVLQITFEQQEQQEVLKEFQEVA